MPGAFDDLSQVALRLLPPELSRDVHACHARVGGYDLRAAVAVPAHDRARLERLCRHTLRPPSLRRHERGARLAIGRRLDTLQQELPPALERSRRM